MRYFWKCVLMLQHTHCTHALPPPPPPPPTHTHTHTVLVCIAYILLHIALLTIFADFFEGSLNSFLRLFYFTGHIFSFLFGGWTTKTTSGPDVLQWVNSVGPRVNLGRHMTEFWCQGPRVRLLRRLNDLIWHAKPSSGPQLARQPPVSHTCAMIAILTMHDFVYLGNLLFVHLNGGRAHHDVIESKVQWKPFWLVTQLYPHNDKLGGIFPYTMT